MQKNILILGAGIGGAKFLTLAHQYFHGDPNIRISVVDRQNYSTFTPMLHEVATGSVSYQHITQPIREIASCCLHRLYHGDLQKIDLSARSVQVNGETIPYDYLVVALGARTNFFNTPGTPEHVFDLKSMSDAVALRRQMIDVFEKAAAMPQGPERSALLHFVIVGGGYTGVELAGQMAALFFNDFPTLYKEISPQEIKVSVVQGGKRILSTLKPKSSEKAMKRLAKLGVEVILNARACAVDADGVALSTGQKILSKTVIWSSGVVSNADKFFSTGLLEKGRVKVKSTLQVFGHEQVFVVGDMAAVMEGNGPHPQTAQVAVKEAEIAAHNVWAMIHEHPLKPFYYQHKGDLVPIGDKWALAEMHGLRFSGFPAWWLRRTVYLLGMYSWHDRLRVVIDWTLNLFTHRDTTQL